MITKVVGYVACFGYAGISLLLSIQRFVPRSPELIAAGHEDHYAPWLGVVFVVIGLIMYWCGDVLLRQVHHFERLAPVRFSYVAGSLVLAMWVLTVMGPKPRVVVVTKMKLISSEISVSSEFEIVTRTNR